MQYATVLKYLNTVIHKKKDKKWHKCSGKHYPYPKSRLLEHLSIEWVDNLCLYSTCRCVMFYLCCDFIVHVYSSQ